jgi:predicted DNA-binding transcriptional regulator AlpA
LSWETAWSMEAIAKQSESVAAIQVLIQPLLVDAETLARMLGVSRATVFNMNADGRLGPMPIRIGTRTLWRTEELARWVAGKCPPRERWIELEEN